MKYIVIILFLLISCRTSFCEIKKVNNSLSSKSVILAYNYALSYRIDNNAQELLNSDCNQKYNYLLNDLLIEDKAVISHIILTKLLEPKKDVFEYKYIFDKENEVTDLIYTFNNISWKYKEGDPINNIIDYDKEKLYKYWKSIILELER